MTFINDLSGVVGYFDQNEKIENIPTFIYGLCKTKSSFDNGESSGSKYGLGYKHDIEVKKFKGNNTHCWNIL